ncbi:FAD dependent oxidoreductase [Phialemonium atrogriseum]|uniref:FAD dependent oxidoreductase n=1 Tax=Phialemonium atrogriseum TaxID=1093897 RepID=A0AAJ0C2M3_9PEZI|nr:FAD dependent oxidoreductase [Phialemonium atrogriseum]KAK1768805.1 FAD dependent oxidoreductase [Phialemonium atrogriseum]
MSATVILGAGIIGVSTAYYLSEHQPPSSVHLVDPSPKLFSSASGFAGGFLAEDWFSPAVASLGALSFQQHRKLAESRGGRQKWGYSTSTSVGYTAATRDGVSKARVDDWLRRGASRAETATAVVDDLAGRSPPWLRRKAGDCIEMLGKDGTTAQLDPLELSQFLLQECLNSGVQLHHPATALSVRTDAVRGELASIRIAATQSSTETDIPCTRVIIAAGAWSAQVFETLFRHSQLKLPILSLAGHSLVVASPRWTKELEDAGCHAVFTTSGPGYSPEIVSRIGGNIYIAGLNSSAIPLPEPAGPAKAQEASIARLKQSANELLGSDAGHDDLEILREGLCFRPVTPSGKPIISRIPDEHLGIGVNTRAGADGGVYVAAGHGPWGISLSLGTGMVLAEMAQGRTLSADVSALGL